MITKVSTPLGQERWTLVRSREARLEVVWLDGYCRCPARQIAFVLADGFRLCPLTSRAKIWVPVSAKGISIRGCRGSFNSKGGGRIVKRGLASDAGDVVRRGWSWWTGELRDLIPGLSVPSSAAADADLVVVVQDGRMAAALPALPQASADNAASIEAAIVEHVTRLARRKTPRILIRVPVASCLERTLDLPRSARGDAARIAALDLERSTPFRSQDIVSAHCVDDNGSAGRTVRIRQFVLKRARLAPVCEALERAGARIVGADIQDADGVVLPINLLAADVAASGDGADRSGSRVGLLVAALTVIVCAIPVIDIWRHEAALADLRRQTSALRERLQDADAATARHGQDMGASVALAQFKAERPPVVSVVENLSRKLPDSAWLTDFRMDKETLDITGYGRPAATLAPAIEKSPLISTASLTAPIIADAEQQRERFSLRLTLATRVPPSGIAAAAVDAEAPADGPLAAESLP